MKLPHMFDNVEYPYPGRRLQGIVSAPVRGRFLCTHRYNQTGSHEDIIENGGLAISIRHYKCRKCGRVTFVFGPTDDKIIEQTIQNYRKQARHE